MIATIEKLGPHTKDEAGNRYGRLMVLEYAGSGEGKHRHVRWLCLCDCGKETTMDGTRLRSEKSPSCGCGRSSNEAGNRYGRLTVLGRVQNNKYESAQWQCQCDCGEKKVILGTSLRAGDTESCGCLRKEVLCLPEGEAAFNSLYSNIKYRAKIRNYDFQLTKERVRRLVVQNCNYCGASPSQIISPRGNGAFIYNGLDRIDNNLGYLAANVVPCCKHCNWAKRTMSVDEFKSWLTRAYKHFVEGNTR